MTTVAVNLSRPEEELGEIPHRLRAAGLELRLGSGRRSTPVGEVIDSLHGASVVIAGQERYTAEGVRCLPRVETGGALRGGL